MAVPFKSILCGVEGHPISIEAARQAIALAAPGAALRFVAVYTTFELGPDSTKERLQEGLDAALRLAEEGGVTATAELLEGRYAVDVLLPEAEKSDLLVIGTHGRSRAAGIVLGSTASEAAHETKLPLLIARETAESGRFPGSILLASDGSEGSWAPARIAGGIAAALGAQLEVVNVDDGRYPNAADVAHDQVAELQEMTGSEPPLTRPPGKATEQIVEAAGQRSTALLVCGRRGLSGVKALGSVSERVVHQADCSVLLVPAD